MTMKLTRSTFTWAIVALAALACISALVGHPVANYIPPDVLAALGAAGAMPFMTGETRTLQDQIKRLQDTRTAKALELEGVQKKALDEGRTKDESEREAFKGLTTDISQIDAELADLRELEALQITKAVPVAGGAAAGTGAVARGALATGGAPAIHMNKDADEKFKGQNYTRIVIAKALSRLSDGDASPLAIAEARWGKTNPTLINVMKAAVPGGGTGTGEWGAELAAIDQRYTGDFIEFLNSQTVYDKLPLRQIPANVQIKGQDGAATAYWVGQSKAIPATTADFFNVNLTPLKVAALAVVSNELLRDSSPSAEQLVRDALVEASSQRVDSTFLSASAGSAGISPAGILNGLTGIVSAGTDGAGLRAVFIGQTRGQLGIAGRDGLGDGGMLVPQRLALRLGLQHGAHGAAQMAPVLVGTLGDQWVAGGRINGLVKGQVGVQHGLHAAPARGAPAGRDQPGVDLRAPGRRQPRGQHIERAAHLVDLGHPVGVQRRDQHAAARRVEHEAVLLEQAQRLQHGLARHSQALRDVFLRDALAGCHRAAADRVQQRAVDLFDEVGRGGNL